MQPLFIYLTPWQLSVTHLIAQWCCYSANHPPLQYNTRYGFCSRKTGTQIALLLSMYCSSTVCCGLCSGSGDRLRDNHSSGLSRAVSSRQCYQQRDGCTSWRSHNFQLQRCQHRCSCRCYLYQLRQEAEAGMSTTKLGFCFQVAIASVYLCSSYMMLSSTDLFDFALFLSKLCVCVCVWGGGGGGGCFKNKKKKTKKNFLCGVCFFLLK